jgi:tryptophan synthase beta subunit
MAAAAIDEANPERGLTYGRALVGARDDLSGLGRRIRGVAVEDEEAFEASHRLARTEGIMAGVSAGAALHAAVREAADAEHPGRTIVVFLADTVERYLSSPLFRRS